MEARSVSPVEVNLEFTPNPDTLKYAVNRVLIPNGVANYVKVEEAQGSSKLAEQLFALPGVSAVMFGKDFVTLTVRDQSQLQDLHPRVLESLQNFLESGEPVVSAPK